MERLTNNNAEMRVDRRTGEATDEIPMPLTLAIELMPYLTAARPPEGLDEVSDLFDVLIGPFGLLTDTYEACGHAPA